MAKRVARGLDFDLATLPHDDARREFSAHVDAEKTKIAAAEKTAKTAK